MTSEHPVEAAGASQSERLHEARPRRAVPDEAGRHHAHEYDAPQDDRREALDALTAQAVSDGTYFLRPASTTTR